MLLWGMKCAKSCRGARAIVPRAHGRRTPWRSHCAGTATSTFLPPLPAAVSTAARTPAETPAESGSWAACSTGSQAAGTSQRASLSHMVQRCRGGGRTCRARVGYRSAHTTSRIRVGVGQTERTACVAAAIEQALRAGIERENKAGVMEKKRKKGGVTPSPPRVSLRGVLQTDEPITHPHLAYPPAYNTP
jgi:hypothetical protein